MKSETFEIDVEGLGKFQVKHRTQADYFAIEREYSELTGGISNPSPMLETFAGVCSTLRVLVVQSPDGWDIDKKDLLLPDTRKELIDVFTALRGAEDRFRGIARDKSETSGSGNGEESGLLVSKEVQPTTE